METKFWYFITVIYCPVCGHEERYRERRYTPRPVESLTAEVERLRGALEIEGDNTQSWKNLFRQKDKAWQEEHTERIRLEERLKHVEGVLERLREMDNDALQGGEG